MSFETRELTLRAIESVERSTGVDPEIWVVDNASTDGTAQAIRARFPAVRPIVMERNVGFGRANNAALEQIRAPWVLLLNHDAALPDPTTLARLVASLEARPGTAVLGPLPAPNLLNLIALKRELELPRVLQHIPRQRHGEVEVQPELALVNLRARGSFRTELVLILVEPAQHVDLFGGFPLTKQLFYRLHRARFQRNVSVQFEYLLQLCQQLLLDHALGR